MLPARFHGRHTKLSAGVERLRSRAEERDRAFAAQVHAEAVRLDQDRQADEIRQAARAALELPGSP